MDPVDPALFQIEQMTEIEIPLVKDDVFPWLQSGAEFARAAVVMLARGVDDHALRQQALQVQAQMRFGGGFATAVLGPIHGVGHQFNHGGVDNVDRGFEPVGAPSRLAPDELRREPAEMIEHAPEKPLRLGGTAPRMPAKAPQWSCKASHTSFKPIECAS